MPADDASLQAKLERTETHASGAASCASPPIADPVALLAHLVASGRFHRDGRAGRMYHAGQVSLREDVASDSLICRSRTTGCAPTSTRRRRWR